MARQRPSGSPAPSPSPSLQRRRTVAVTLSHLAMVRQRHHDDNATTRARRDDEAVALALVVASFDHVAMTALASLPPLRVSLSTTTQTMRHANNDEVRDRACTTAAATWPSAIDATTATTTGNSE